MTHNSSLTTHNSSLTTHNSSLTTHYSQLITHYSLLLCLLVFPALEALAQEEAADAYARIAADIRPAVVTIVVYEYSGSLKHIGSGFFYTENGDIVTNSHVLVPNARAEIRTPDGKKYPVGAILERNEAIDKIGRAHV